MEINGIKIGARVVAVVEDIQNESGQAPPKTVHGVLMAFNDNRYCFIRVVDFPEGRKTARINQYQVHIDNVKLEKNGKG